MTTQATTPALPAVPPPHRAPHDPARIPEIVAALKKVGPLHDLEQAEYEWLANHGTEVFAESGAVVFREGEPAPPRWLSCSHERCICAGSMEDRRLSLLAALARSPPCFPSPR